MKKLCHYISEYMGVLVLLSAVAALAFPEVFSVMKPKVINPLLVLLLAGQTVDVDVVGMLLSILWVVILPIAAGLLVKRFWPRQTAAATAYLPALSTLAICAIVLIVIAANASKLLSSGLIVILVVMLHNVGGLAVGYAIGTLLGMPAAKRKAVSIEVGMQNSGLASSLATLHFAAYPLATIPGAIFSVWHNISGAIVARIYNPIGLESDKSGQE